MQTTETAMLERALLLRDDVAAGRFHGVDCRFAANILGAWLRVVKEELDEALDEETVSMIERVYDEIERRLAAH